VAEPSEVSVLRDQVKHSDHLTKDQHLVALSSEFRKQLVQQNHLSTGHHISALVQQILLLIAILSFEFALLKEFSKGLLHLSLFHAIQQERMVAALSELHLNIHQLWSIRTGRTHTEKGVIVFKDSSVVLLLDAGELNIDDGFFFGGDILGDVLLHTTKHVRRNLPLESLDLLTIGHVPKLGLELFHAGKLVGFNEIQQRP